jgi:transposase
MANKVTSMQILRMIIQMLDQKTSERRISKQLNISRNTVKYYREQLHLSSRTYKELQSLDDAGLSAILYADSSSLQPEDERKDDFRSQVPYFLSELRQTGVTRQLLWEECIVGQPDGYRYSQFCFHLNELSKVLQPSFHAKYNAAEVVMIDFAGSQMHFIDTSTGEEIGFPVLVCILPFSNLTYVQALPNAKLPNLIAALNNCLRYFNGAPLSLKTDNMKQIVQKSNRYEPVLLSDAVKANIQSISSMKSTGGPPMEQLVCELFTEGLWCYIIQIYGSPLYERGRFTIKTVSNQRK